MNCWACTPITRLVETKSTGDEVYFYQYYECPRCGGEYICSSQSGDMVQENLDTL